MSPSVAILGTRGYPSYYGGFETAVRKLAPYLANHGWDVTVYGRPGATRVDDATLDHRVSRRVTRGLESKSLSTLTFGLSSSYDAARRRPDVALVMNVANGLWIPLLKSRGVPTLVNVDGIEWERAKWGRIAKSVFRAGARATARHGSRMVYDSREIARWWRERFGLDGDFIPYGGDVPPQLPIEPGLQHRGYVLVVARLVPENSIPEFLEAVPELARNTDVVIVGTSGYGGEVEERVRASAERNPRVRWLGQVADDNRLLSLWQHAGAYFHGHSVGGTNPALVQAMACGAPIVARDTVYNREVLGDSGLFTALDSASMVATISGLVSDVAKQQALSAAAERRAIELYSWDRVCADYETALRLLLDAKANRR